MGATHKRAGGRVMADRKKYEFTGETKFHFGVAD
jgi:hypothetical protein